MSFLEKNDPIDMAQELFDGIARPYKRGAGNGRYRMMAYIAFETATFWTAWGDYWAGLVCDHMVMHPWMKHYRPEEVHGKGWKGWTYGDD